MRDKFILQQFDENDNLIKQREMKTIRDISNLLSIEYFQARQLYLHNKKNTKAHPFIKELSKRFKIIDNDTYKPANIMI
jgi:hypothetical protein